ncbi:MAG: DUF4157 domain-containing protein, partial [Bacteroidota bacterium]
MPFKPTRRTRRHRNPHQGEQTGKDAFFQPVQKKEDPAFFQPKLKIGEPDDEYEREADAVADKVVSGQKGNKTEADGNEPPIQTMADSRMEEDRMVQEKPEEEEPVQMQEAEEEESVQMAEEEEEQVQMAEEEEEQVQMAEEEEEQVQMAEEEEEQVQMMEGEEEEQVQMMEGEEEEQVQMMEGEEEEVQMMGEEEEEPVQAKATNPRRGVSRELPKKLRDRAGKGRPMEGEVKEKMEAGFGRDFSDVNLHTDAAAEEMNKELGAKAFARGKDIYFNSGEFNPDTAEGQRLLAHELTHTVQQGGAESKGSGPAVQRNAEQGEDGKFTGNYIFRNNTFFRKVRYRLGNGTLTDEELIELKQYALRQNGTVMHAELLLMAAALNPDNLDTIRAHRAPELVLSMDSIKPADRQHVLDVDRNTADAEVLAAEAEAAKAPKGSAERAAAEKKLETAAFFQLDRELQGSSYYEKGLQELTAPSTVPLHLILRAMLAAAADNTVGDKVMAGVAFIVAKEAGHPMADRLLDGSLKVDALKSSVYDRFLNRSVGSYSIDATQDKFKADTLYLRMSSSRFNVQDRALIIHELTHTAEDFSAKKGDTAKHIDMEVRAYAAQGRYTLEEMINKSDVDETNAMASITRSGLKGLKELRYWMYVAGARTNPDRYRAPLVALLSAPPMSASEEQIKADLALSKADVLAKLREAILGITNNR